MTVKQTAGQHSASFWSRLRVERRIEQPRWLSFVSPFILVLLALLFGAVLLRLAGASPWGLAFGGLQKDL